MVLQSPQRMLQKPQLQAFGLSGAASQRFRWNAQKARTKVEGAVPKVVEDLVAGGAATNSAPPSRSAESVSQRLSSGLAELALAARTSFCCSGSSNEAKDWTGGVCPSGLRFWATGACCSRASRPQGVRHVLGPDFTLDPQVLAATPAPGSAGRTHRSHSGL